MMKRLPALFFLLLCQGAGATVNEQLDYEYYTARAVPDRSLLSVINEATPFHDRGVPLIGYTFWHINWHLQWQETAGGRCHVTEVKTDLATVVNLPQVVHPTPKQQAQFDKFIAALRTHEMGHYQNGKQAATEIDSGIAALPEMASCKALQAAADELGNRLIKEYAAKDVQYDAQTSHGKTQGAVLPE